MNPTSTKGLKKFIFKILNVKSKKILELGCGKGVLSEMLRKENEVTSVDIEKNYQNVLIRDLNKDFKLDKKFDLIVALELIEHLENPRHFFGECLAYLKTGGKMILSTPITDGFKQRIYFLLKRNIYGFREKDYKHSGHITPLMEYDFIRLAKEFNLNIKFRKYKDIRIVELTKKNLLPGNIWH
ncbi:MAG: class I SAM-dependent methyltransferase [Nanoarchaeota archaeon]|nr:class I SAM-dependent methyltransferase [Nanoarchaeota archaeon]